MGKYVQDFRYDVFLSYAHVDDQPLEDDKPGWVTTFSNHLKKLLAQRLGRADAFDLWMDHDLKHSGGVTPQIMDILNETAILLVVLSPGYTASTWCQRERKKFLGIAANQFGSRIIVVEREKEYESQSEELIPDKKKFEFWMVDETGRSRILGPPARQEQLYWDRVDDVSMELAHALREIRGSQENLEHVASVEETALPVSEKPTVYLAQVTDDLEPQRYSVQRYLEQFDIEVLPKAHYSLDSGTFRESAERDLSRSSLFVQLLGASAGKKPPDLPEGFNQLQFDLAQSATIPVWQWRRPDLPLDDILDPDHLDLVDSPTVRAEGLEDIKKEIVRFVTTPQESEAASPDAIKIFICADPGDRPIAEELSIVLGRSGAECSLPTQSSDPGDYRKDLEQNLNSCDGMIIVYGDAPSTWVEHQLRQCRRARLMRDSRLAWAVYQAHPLPKDPLSGGFRDLAMFTDTGDYDEAALKEFLKGLSE